MIRRLLPVLGSVLVLTLWVLPVRSFADEGCDAMRTRWMNAFERLKASAASVRQTKEASLASRIQQELSERGNGASVARGVQAVLKERSTALMRERSQCRDLAVQENETFDQWRRCAVGGNPRRGALQASGLDAANAERKKLLSSLQELLLDDAYVQYKNYQAPAPPAYSGYDQQQAWGTGRNPGYGYYQGYGGYR